MAYFYVKSGGTATGDGGRVATQRTGSFASMGASAYYDSVEDASNATTPFAHGDFICISDLHAKVHAADTSWHNASVPFSEGDKPITFISVDDANCEDYKKATTVQESHSTQTDTSLSGTNGDDNSYAYIGIFVHAGDDISIMGQSAHYLKDCTLRVSEAADKALFLNGYANVLLDGCTLMADGSAASQWISKSLNSVLECINSKFTTDQSSKSVAIIENASPVVTFDNCDFTDSKAEELISTSVAVNNKLVISGLVRNCKFNTEMADYTRQSDYRLAKLLVTNSADTSAAAEYQYYYEEGDSFVQDETSFYRDNSSAFPSGQKISLKCVTLTGVNGGHPFIFNYPSRLIDLSDTASDVVTLYLLCANSLTDADVRVELLYPDGTVKHQTNMAESVALDPFSSGTALDSDTEAWTGRTTENRYKIDIDTSGDAGAEGAPNIRVFVAKPSETIYFCPTLGVS